MVCVCVRTKDIYIICYLLLFTSLYTLSLFHIPTFQVKLLHIPQALTRGVDVFMLDLDVGFLASPQYMVKVFEETPIVDIFIQVLFIIVLLLCA